MPITKIDLQNRLYSIATSIANIQSERQGYLDKAAEIQEVYDKMLEDKETIEGYRKDVKTFYDNEYDDFKGCNFNTTYKPTKDVLETAYDGVIDGIDSNLDALNNKILEYKNKASECYGLLGGLEMAYNSVKTRIQNWVN